MSKCLALRGDEPLRIMQMAFIHDDYILAVHKRNKKYKTFKECIDNFIADYYWGGHILTPELAKMGYNTFLCVPRDILSQALWCAENGVSDIPQEAFVYGVCMFQIAAYKPDILYISHPQEFGDAFIEALPWKPPVIVGWSAAATPPLTSWKFFDAILSSHDVSMDRARESGAQRVIYSLPGFPEALATELSSLPKRTDVSFSGYWSPFHHHRNALLTRLARKSLGEDFSLAYYLPFFHGAEPIPEEVARLNRGAGWGKSMYVALARSKVTLNAHCEIDGRPQNLSPNLRQFEATGVGALLLNEVSPNIEAFFDPCSMLVLFEDEHDLLEKICYYLVHEHERAEIAAKGQQHCLQSFSMRVRARAFVSKIAQIIKEKTNDKYPVAHMIALAKKFSELPGGMDFNEEHGAILQSLIQYALASPYHVMNDIFLTLQRFCPVNAMNWKFLEALVVLPDQPERAKSLLKEELSSWPENDEARHTLSHLLIAQRA